MDKKTVISNFKPEAVANTTLALKNFAGLRDDQLNWKPAPERWSINQCLEHINITTRHWTKEVKRVVESGGKKTDNAGEYHRTGIGGFLIRSLLTPKPRKFKTSKNFDPPTTLDSKKVMKDFIDLQRQWEDEIDKIQEYDIVRNRVHSPFFHPITYRLGNGIELNNIHTRRHLTQAVNVMKEPGFPGNLSFTQPEPGERARER